MGVHTKPVSGSRDETPARPVVGRPFPDTIEARFVGYLGVESIDLTIAEFDKALASAPANFALFDTGECTRFSPQLGDPGARIIELMREHDVTAAIVIVKNSGLRMLASTVAFVGRFPAEFVDTREEAERRLLERRAKVTR